MDVPRPTDAERKEFKKVFGWSKQRAGKVHKHDHVVWTPQLGAQRRFLACPVYECLLSGSRGSGKSDALLFSFAQHVGRGFGHDWRGIIFRQTYPQLGDIIAKSLRFFPKIFPKAKLNRSRFEWSFPDGEVLMFRHIQRPDDYYAYHGHSFSFIGFEELANWPSPDCYQLMHSCARSSNESVPIIIRANTNPWGPGFRS
jgi:hypothetical protein